MTESDLFGQSIVSSVSPVNAGNPVNTGKIDFSKIIGQEKIKTLLEKAIKDKRIPNAYLFYGPEGTGKDAMAVEFGKAINCSSEEKIPCEECKNCRLIGQLVHPDFKFVFAAPAKIKEEDIIKHLKEQANNHYARSAYSETAGILIDQIRELKKISAMTLYMGKHRIFIISEADRLNAEAGNSLLKLLEEPPDHLILILTTVRLDKLLPTIISRCQVIKFSPLSEKSIAAKLGETGIEVERAKVTARLAMGNYRKALTLQEDDYQLIRDQAWKLLLSAQVDDDIKKLDLITEISVGKDRGQIKEFFLLSLLWLRDLLVFYAQNKDSPNKKTLFNGDKLEKLEQLSKLYNDINLEKTITETENFIDLIDKNVYINLILINYVNCLFNNTL